MELPVINQCIVVVPGKCGNKPHIAGHRITVQWVAVKHEKMKWSVNKIAAEYNLTLSEAYTALAYYHENKVAIDQSILEEELFVEQLKQKNESKLNN